MLLGWQVAHVRTLPCTDCLGILGSIVTGRDSLLGRVRTSSSAAWQDRQASSSCAACAAAAPASRSTANAVRLTNNKGSRPTATSDFTVPIAYCEAIGSWADFPSFAQTIHRPTPGIAAPVVPDGVRSTRR